MTVEIIGAESLGVRGLCCQITLPDRRIVIDPGVALGYVRHKLLPYPLQVAVGCNVRDRILAALSDADEVVFSHFHGDHIPLAHANPYQLSLSALPSRFKHLQGWCPSDRDLSAKMHQRYLDLRQLLGERLQMAEGERHGAMTFSQAFPHGDANSAMGTVMMTRVDMGSRVFVHASDIQLLNDAAVDQILRWQPDIVLAAGPPLYLERLNENERACAWQNALRLAQNIEVLILDHHMMRSEEGLEWLDRLSDKVGRPVMCAADFMQRPRLMLEADRARLYEAMPVPENWHQNYEAGIVDFAGFLESSDYPDVLR